MAECAAMAASTAVGVGTGVAGGTSLLRCRGLERGGRRHGSGIASPVLSYKQGHYGCSASFAFLPRAPFSGHTARSVRTVASASSLEERVLQTAEETPASRLDDEDGGMFFLQRSMLTVAAGLTPLLLDAPDAVAGGGEFGLLEGRSLALVHPLVMGGLFFYTLYAGYLGWQWRSVRTVQDEINELKKLLVPAATSAEAPAPPSPVETKIQELTEYRKQLVKGGFRDRHFNAGSILLAFGVFEAVGGSLNTWFRTGKLFPGPHLFAGAGITVLWALAAALVPAMQKGNESARNAHIALNVLNVGLFVWQIPTGWEIVGKVLEFTTWP